MKRVLEVCETIAGTPITKLSATLARQQFQRRTLERSLPMRRAARRISKALAN
jgi:hypothetical protein